MQKKKIYVITVSKRFLKDHPKAGKETDFVNKILQLRKIHTIRSGDYWKKVVQEVNSGKALLSVRTWTGKPYASKQEEFCLFQKLGWQDFEFKNNGNCIIDHFTVSPDMLNEIAKNDGLDYQDFLDWFKYPKPFKGGIIHFTEFKYENSRRL